MSEDKVRGVPLIGPFFSGSFEQRRAIGRWEDAGWTFLHWAEVPRIMAVLQNLLGDIIFIDESGWAWKGPTFDKSKPVPLEEYPPLKSSEVSAT
jgi:hypothetical protein